MVMLWLPQAERNEHDRSNPWTEKTDPKGCLHTTEGSSWPTYRDWTVMPHATILPTPGKGVKVRQHIAFDQGSFALRNLDGGVQTNRDYIFQFELIGTSEKGGPGLYWPDADEKVLLDLYRKVIEPLSKAYGIPLKARPFQAYPSSYGPNGKTNTVRLSGTAFDNYSGWLGHQHVPENVHGDPGAFPWARMMAAVAAEEEEMAGPTEKDFKTWMKEVLQDRTLVQNIDGDKAVIGTMSVLDALRLGDYKADQDWAEDRAQTALLERIAAQVAADTNLNEAEIERVVAAVKAAVIPAPTTKTT